MKLLPRCTLIPSIILAAFLAAYAQSGNSEIKKGTASISGQITSGGKPIRGIVVIARPQLRNQQQMMKYMLGQAPMPRSTTDAEGNFAFTSLEVGSYQIEINAPTMVGMRMPANDSDKPHLNQNVIVGDGETIENLNYSITRGGVITGRVTRSDGSPAIGESVKLQPQASKAQGFSRLSGVPLDYESFTTDDRGIYRIYGVPHGRYKVVAGSGSDPIRDVFRTNRRTRQVFYPGTTDQATAGIVEISGGVEVREIDIKLNPPENTYFVKGRVIDETGKPAPNVVVKGESVYPNSGAPLSPFAAPSTVTANSQGEFTVRDLPPGAYKFTVSAALKGEQTFYSDEPEVQIKNSTISGLEIHLHKDIPVSGQVIIEGANDTALLSKQPMFISLRSYTPRKSDPKIDDSTTVTAPISPDGTFTFRGLKPSKARILLFVSPSLAELAIIRVERGGTDITDGFEIQAVAPSATSVLLWRKKTARYAGKLKLKAEPYQRERL